MWIKAAAFAPRQSAGMKQKCSVPILITALSYGALLLMSCSRAPQAPPKTVQITASDKMKYSLTAFEVKPGQQVSITLMNVGTSPKASMGHNFILLKQNTNVKKFLDDGSMHAAQDYIAPEFAQDVIAHTKLLGPGESDTVTFTAPYVPGDYVFLCAFPGHYASGMHGLMTVKQ